MAQETKFWARVDVQLFTKYGEWSTIDTDFFFSEKDLEAGIENLKLEHFSTPDYSYRLVVERKSTETIEY